MYRRLSPNVHTAGNSFASRQRRWSLFSVTLLFRLEYETSVQCHNVNTQNITGIKKRDKKKKHVEI